MRWLSYLHATEAQMNGVELHECPNCGGEMYSKTSDEYCLECIHEGRV